MKSLVAFQTLNLMTQFFSHWNKAKPFKNCHIPGNYFCKNSNFNNFATKNFLQMTCTDKNKGVTWEQSYWGEAPLVRDSRKFVCLSVCLSVYVGLTIIKVNKLLTLIAGFAPSMFYILLVKFICSKTQI